MTDLALIVALAAVLIWVVTGTAEKELAKLLGGKRTSFIILGGGLIIIAVFYLSTFSMQMTATSLLFSIGSGVVFAAAALLYYRALEKEEVSISYSIGLFQPAILFIYGITVLNESVGAYQALSGLIVLIGVLLVATKRHLKFDRKLMPIFLANILWAVYWVFLSQSIIGVGQIAFPLIISRAVGALIIVLLYGRVLANQRKVKSAAKTIHHIVALGIAVGILDGAANVIYSYLIILNSLALGSIVTVLGPFFVVLLAYVVYKERITRIQAAGLVLAAIGAIALAIA